MNEFDDIFTSVQTEPEPAPEEPFDLDAWKEKKQTDRQQVYDMADDTTIKTAEQTAKITQRSAQAAARTAQVTAHAARVAAHKAAVTAKAAAKAVISSVRAIIAATRALITTLAAGGSVAFLIVVVICLIGLLVGSVFGIFFSGEDTGSGLTMRSAIREINQDYQDQIDGIQNTVVHDELEMSGCFVSWCAEQCGYIEAGIIPKFAGCPTGEQWFKDRGQWADRNYLPNPGDIIFLDWASDGIDGLADHVGIVERCEGGIVYTVEGNMTNSCKQRQYTVGYYEICGYGVPAY